MEAAAHSQEAKPVWDVQGIQGLVGYFSAESVVMGNH